MAEVYATMDKAAADGMKTSSDKTAAVADAWARVRSDATAIDWAAFVLEGKAYKLRAEGSGVPAMLEALSEDCVTFAGFRADVGGGVKFFHLLYVGSGVGIIKRNKAQLQKNAPFNAMDGAAGDLELPPDEKTAEKLAALVAAA
ncbi:hypothetical protein JL722_5200 [Aureococcus anophagefferens]|nr:hypothetical protein JL722_5200 [Aureococcus anophagefferens]